MNEFPSKVLVIGSGAIKISEAAEFDYSGSQALKALREEGIETVLVNPNIATIQTSYRFAHHVYMGPIEDWYVEKVVDKELPDGILLGFGGQTALSLGVSLHDKGILSRYGIKVLGTSIDGIRKALSRALFRETMLRHGIPVPPSAPASEQEEALRIASDIGYPVIVRVSFNLGGGGSFIAWKKEDLESYLYRAFAQSGIREILVEKYLYHWKEIEFEVVRDKEGNKTAVACLENMDPMGVHTGDSVVVAPCQTLSDAEYQDLRTASLNVGDSIGLVGEGNVQLALNPYGEDYYAIETNPRMSRSSSLASKATGYPLAYIAAKLALGYKIYEIINKVTGKTCSCFEPSLDYVVVKIPRWDLDKFEGVEKSLSSEMKSIGEVMAIGRNLGEALQKAIRMLDIGREGLVDGKTFKSTKSINDLIKALQDRQPYWPIIAAEAFIKGATIKEIYHVTGIDPYFLEEIKRISEFSLYIANDSNIKKYIGSAKRLGFSDKQLAQLTGIPERVIMKLRQNGGLSRSRVNQVDTLAAEWPSNTGYLYLTYNTYKDDGYHRNEERNLLILGAGVFRIGVSVEFDWGIVSFSEEASKLGYRSVIINYNPETVSTDWDIGHRLYFEELIPERIKDIYDVENPVGVVGFLGGQISNNLARKLMDLGLQQVGTDGYSVDKAENRAVFSSLLEELGLKQPPWIEAKSADEAMDFAGKVGYPVLVRPSYVLSGSSMSIAYSDNDLDAIIRKARVVSLEYPLVVSKYIENAVEVELDCVGDSRKAICGVIEHIEPAGIHSGDSTMVIPWFSIESNIINEITRAASAINKYLNIKGPFNIQFLVKNGAAYVIELNLRTSRSMPFTSKVNGYSLMKAAAEASLYGRINTFPPVNPIDDLYLLKPSGYWGVKSPQFSWSRLRNSYPSLGPEMKSTGEVAALGLSLSEALIKSWLSVKPNKIPELNQVLLIYSPDTSSSIYLEKAAAIFIDMGYEVSGLESAWSPGNLSSMSIKEAREMIKEGRIGLIGTKSGNPRLDYGLRRDAVDYNVPILLDDRLTYMLARSLRDTGGIEGLKAVELSEYWNSKHIGVL